MNHDMPAPAAAPNPASPRGCECNDMLAALDRLGANRDTRIHAVVRLFTRADPPPERPGLKSARG